MSRPFQPKLQSIPSVSHVGPPGGPEKLPHRESPPPRLDPPFDPTRTSPHKGSSSRHNHVSQYQGNAQGSQLEDNFAGTFDSQSTFSTRQNSENSHIQNSHKSDQSSNYDHGHSHSHSLHQNHNHSHDHSHNHSHNHSHSGETPSLNVPNFKLPETQPHKRQPPLALKPTQPLSASLPTLVAFPLLVSSSSLSLASGSGSAPRVAVTLLQACTLLLVARGVCKYTKTPVHGSASFAAAAVLFYVACSFLANTRTTTVLFCLFVSPWNMATPVFFVYDLISAFAASSPLWAVPACTAGYVATVGCFALSQRVLSGKSDFMHVPVTAVVVVGALSLVGLVSMYTDRIQLPFLAIATACATIMSFSLSESVIFAKKNVFIVAGFSYVLECFVLRSRPVAFVDLLVCVAVPMLVKIDRTRQFSVGPETSAAEKPRMLQEILAHSDTKAIFNFLMLNSAFMFVQLVYSFRSKSLGLLSDSLHMALDCASLALGLVAGVLSKNKVDVNSKFPFGLRNFEILAGFANGTLLVGISGSIIFEAIGRLFNPVSLQQTTELIIVSILGLLVNIVGIFAFNHGHGHSHGHSHSHAESHSHSHSHSHSDSHDESDSQSCEGMNDNMRGIFLHILADTLGSVGVVISTILTQLFSWQGFDPVASIIIAVLIFLTAVPLMKSTASTLLLKLDSRKEDAVRSSLNGLTKIKGVKSFTSPRFWTAEKRTTGLIHVQVYRGENTAHLRKSCEAVFRDHNIDVLIQMENDYDACWCR